MTTTKKTIPSRAGARTLVSLDAAAEYLSVHRRTVRRYVDDGLLPAYRIGPGRILRVDLREVDALLAATPSTR